MKIVLFTTQTPHHVYLVQKVNQVFPIERIISEEKRLSPPFETHHSFEDAIDPYEKRVWFQGREPLLDEIAPAMTVYSVNDDVVFEYLHSIKPDVIVAAGSGRVSKKIIQICHEGFVNLHGGDTEEYRGLDSHLWAIYHNDFNLIATLHRLNAEFDDGEIIVQGAVPLHRDMKLHELRRFNNETCVRLLLSGLDMFARFGCFIVRPQRSRGRYYSFMPAPLKEICRKHFEKYTSAL